MPSGKLNFSVKSRGESLPSAATGHWRALAAFEAVVVDAGKHRGEASDFVHDLGRVAVVPVAAHAVGDELDDLPVGFGFAEGLMAL